MVAFGGGSALDAGKLIALMHGQTRSVFDFEDVGDWWTRADASAIAPVVAVPTTAGTGSEVGRAAVVTNEKTHTKKIIFHPLMLPKQTICDPELTVGMPPVITAGTGMDAFSHGLEALCVPSYHALGDGIAAECVRLVKENLVTAYKDGTNIEARAHMMAAAAAGATAFQKGLGAIHALSHPVGSLYNTHHGLTNAVFVPYVLVFNRKAIEDKIKRLAAYIGLRPSFRAFMDFVLELREQTGIPHTLAGLKVDDAKVDTIVKMAPEDPTAGGNPVKLDRRAARTIFMRALEGGSSSRSGVRDLAGWRPKKYASRNRHMSNTVRSTPRCSQRRPDVVTRARRQSGGEMRLRLRANVMSSIRAISGNPPVALKASRVTNIA